MKDKEQLKETLDNLRIIDKAIHNIFNDVIKIEEILKINSSIGLSGIGGDYMNDEYEIYVKSVNLKSLTNSIEEMSNNIKRTLIHKEKNKELIINEPKHAGHSGTMGAAL
jgi:hypothetical protein